MLTTLRTPNQIEVLDKDERLVGIIKPDQDQFKGEGWTAVFIRKHASVSKFFTHVQAAEYWLLAYHIEHNT